MPLLVVTGYPSSGKTTRAEQIREDLVRRIVGSKEDRERKLKVHIVNDDILKIPKDVYRKAKLEKAARGSLMSSTGRLLTKDDIVICDGLNYIKGFRYQLYCESKALETPHCVVHVGVPKEVCEEWNRSRGDEGYPEDMHVQNRKQGLIW
ncbi:Protein kti12 [Neolecta irregularis DAH-3]|uniref:Protein kti12 n=1 Tax=Neolecta irregularis (strain DAH-3) TaxID=1198029 RepID=A0A1U7LNL2_NEOID|nr:Protein kti12 [Neolecta irregularis DAH-3]|eukprot:OLL24132.1 Protein kti12 [Neolecta irregularis DAH-3]